LENGPHALSPNVVSPTGDKPEPSTNDDILAGKGPLPESLTSDFVCTSTDSGGLDVEER